MNFDVNNFQKEVLETNQLVLVDFFAQWCGPCRIQGPIVDKLAKEYEGKIKIGKMDIDAGQAIAQKYNVLSIPTLIFFKDGQEIKRLVGLQSKDELKKIIDATD